MTQMSLARQLHAAVNLFFMGRISREQLAQVRAAYRASLVY